MLKGEPRLLSTSVTYDLPSRTRTRIEAVSPSPTHDIARTGNVLRAAEERNGSSRSAVLMQLHNDIYASEASTMGNDPNGKSIHRPERKGPFMASLQALTVKIERLTKQAEAIAKRERSGAVHRVVELMRRLGITVADLPGLKSGPKRTNGAARKAAGVAKYRDPATGNTWTGHGRAPQWIKGASNRNDFLIANSQAPAKQVGKRSKLSTASKASNGASPSKRAKAIKGRKTTSGKGSTAGAAA
jgi:DNA-binding protein H-NS